MRRFEQRYVKYLINNPTLFYGFLGLFLVAFFWLSLAIKLDIVKTYPASISGNIVSVEGLSPESISGSTVYYYTNRNERIYRSEAVDIFSSGNKASILISENVSGEISGTVSVDVIVGRQTLLERIFIKAGKN